MGAVRKANIANMVLLDADPLVDIAPPREFRLSC
jgi:hypothetical protein